MLYLIEAIGISISQAAFLVINIKFSDLGIPIVPLNVDIENAKVILIYVPISREEWTPLTKGV